MKVLFVPLFIVFAVVLVIAGLVAGTIHLLGGAWPLALIALGAFLLFRGEHKQRHRRHASRPVPTWTGPAPVAIEEGRRGRRERAGRKAPVPVAEPAAPAELPIDMQVKVDQIRRKVDVLLSYADRFPPYSQDLYLVRQTADDYLPRTIETYLSLSRAATQQPLGVGGRSARDEVRAQLDLLDAKLDEIAQDLQRQDSDRLIANRRFLEQRFGMRGDGDQPTDARVDVA
jgi:hypothetical protein